MTIDQSVLQLLEESVLCWLATSTLQGEPNVSPKEIFKPFKGDSIVIANIASPQSARNINENPRACVSFVNIFTQKGYQITGAASILKRPDQDYQQAKQALEELTRGKFPFKSIFRVSVEQVREIIAPRYRLFPETTEEDQIRSALKTYGVQSELSSSSPCDTERRETNQQTTTRSRNG